METGEDVYDWMAGSLLVANAGGIVTSLEGAQFPNCKDIEGQHELRAGNPLSIERQFYNVLLRKIRYAPGGSHGIRPNSVHP
jgi:fructose-1,6-bisphosphatase/inositol monophosphatase family enzyme